MNVQSISNQNFKHKIDTQLDLSESIADKHLAKIPFHKETSGSTFAPKLNFLSIGGGRTVHHYHDNGRPARKEKKEMSDGSRVLIGVIGSAIMLGGSYFIGKSITARNEAMADLKSTRKFKKKLNKCQEKGQNNADFEKLKNITKATEKILKRTARSSAWAIALKVALVAGAAFAVIGAVVASPVFAAVGGGLALIAGCALLMKWGIERSDRANKRDAQLIKDELKVDEEAYSVPPTAPKDEDIYY